MPGARAAHSSLTHVLVAILLSWAAAEAVARDRIVVVGSSTVYPFSALVAEHFARSGPFSAPQVRATSTAEGFRLFCAAPTGEAPDVGNASRPITAAEKALCTRNGIHRIAEIRIGYDSLILANAAAASTFDVSLRQLWLATAETVPLNGRPVPNPYRSWHDLDPQLPDRPISLIGPSPGHGTRDAFVELVMEPSCQAALAGLSPSPQERRTMCTSIRKDGRWTDVDNLELILGKLATHPDAMGVLTYSYLEQFPNRIHAATVNGVEPSRATIPSGTYVLSRPLFMYVNEDHLRTTVGLGDFAGEFLSFCAAGAHGYLADQGLVPLPASELLRQRAVVARLQR